mgnify:CR=1 FL=1
MLYIISYLLFMIPTYLWRYAFIADAMNNNAMQNANTFTVITEITVNAAVTQNE